MGSLWRSARAARGQRPTSPGRIHRRADPSEGGINIPGPEYLAEAAAICKASGALLISTRSRPAWAAPGRSSPRPLTASFPISCSWAKALSGGIVPIAMGVVRSRVWAKAFGSPERCNLNASTFAGGHLACTAAATVLDIIAEEQLAARAAGMSALLIERLKQLATRHPAIRAVRGRGLLIGVELEPAADASPRRAGLGARGASRARPLRAPVARLRHHCPALQPAPECATYRAAAQYFRSRDKPIRFALDRVLAACPSPRPRSRWPCASGCWEARSDALARPPPRHAGHAALPAAWTLPPRWPVPCVNPCVIFVRLSRRRHRAAPLRPAHRRRAFARYLHGFKRMARR